MKLYLMILLYFPVLSCYAKRSKIGEHGYEGRFSVYDNVHGRTFIATIKNLELQDSGLYYCGLDRWGRDVLTKVDVSVSKAPLVTSLSTHDRKDTTETHRYVSPEVPTFTQLPVADWDVTPTSSSILIDSTAFPSSKVSDPVDIAQGEEDTCHVYDEIIMYSSNILPQEDSDLYCTVHFGEPPLKMDDNALYSLLTLKFIEVSYSSEAAGRPKDVLWGFFGWGVVASSLEHNVCAVE
ncbi:hypothetical protein J4Q44_G00258570 [Coregonus suidteri]|uniref:Uncharacterized protein n=1 Tax=Coregonus suidteri TaxID=861788 RepID=A0AAN8L3L0_9TELE